MKTRKSNIMMAFAVVLAGSGCSTVTAQQLSEKYDRPILSAAEAQSMIRVEVNPLEPLPAEELVMAASQ